MSEDERILDKLNERINRLQGDIARTRSLLEQYESNYTDACEKRANLQRKLGVQVTEIAEPEQAEPEQQPQEAIAEVETLIEDPSEDKKPRKTRKIRSEKG